MDKLIANATLTEFYDYFNPQVDKVSSVGALRRNEDPPSNIITSVLLPKFEVFETQASFIPGLVVGKTKVNLFEKRLKTDLRYEVHERSKKKLVFWYKDQNVYHHIYVLEDLHQFGVAMIFLTGHEPFVEGLRRLALLLHFHFDNKFRLHEHEKSGITNKRKNCTLGNTCNRLVDGSTEEKVFAKLHMPYLKPEDRKLDEVKKAEKRIYARN